MAGLVDIINDPQFWAQQDERNQLIAHLASVFGCDLEAARIWLDTHDAYAVETAQRILAAEPYTDIPVQHTYH